MRIQCPNCKKPIKLSTSQLMNNQSRITCPGCHQAITTQSTIKKDVSSPLRKSPLALKKFK